MELNSSKIEEMLKHAEDKLKIPTAMGLIIMVLFLLIDLLF